MNKQSSEFCDMVLTWDSLHGWVQSQFICNINLIAYNSSVGSYNICHNLLYNVTWTLRLSLFVNGHSSMATFRAHNVGMIWDRNSNMWYHGLGQHIFKIHWYLQLGCPTPINQHSTLFTTTVTKHTLYVLLWWVHIWMNKAISFCSLILAHGNLHE
jgi:hypothetical protein